MKNFLDFLSIRKFIWCVVIISIIMGSIRGKLAVEEYKDKAVRQAIDNIKAQQKDTEIAQQSSIIAQQKIVFVKSQKIIKDSKKIKKEIDTAVSITEKVNIKNSIIGDINCIILNFNNEVVCQN